VLVAAVPIFASSAIYLLYTEGQHSWHLRPGEVLFYSVMASSIALGELIEMIYKDKNFTSWRFVFGAYFLLGIIGSALLYGMNVHHEVMGQSHGPVDGDEKILIFSFALAVAILVPGTLLEIVFDRADRRDGTWRRPSWDS